MVENNFIKQLEILSNKLNTRKINILRNFIIIKFFRETH